METGQPSAEQRAYLDRFCADYVARTRGSQRQREQGWPRLADPRSSSGYSGAPGPVRDFWLATKRLRYPLVGSRCDGVSVWDIDDNEYVDFGLGFGVHLFGHRPAFILDAITDRLARGTPIGFQSEVANEVAEGIARLTGAERVAFSNTGTEAVMSAVRLARAATRRSKLVVFEHSYHGSYDDVVRSIGATRGIPDARASDVLVLGYGDSESLDRIEAEADQIAAVLVEPVQARRPGLQPVEFLHQLRALTARRSIALIFDDVLLGFRVHQGGCQAHFDVRADLATYGKVIGGGLPIGILTGRTEYMNLIDGGAWQHDGDSIPSGDKIWFAGTFNKNPLTMAATQAVVNHLLEKGNRLQEGLTEKARALDERLGAWLVANRMPVRIARFGSMFRFESAPHLTLLIQHLHMRGIYTWEGMVFFISTAHTDASVERLEEAVKDSLLTMRRGGYLD
ncbi:MAG TPA: aminotransferase class III-fold pyridoxal phosphate-dependent enzyme [Kofleriaceae bacterium]|nr:aminotransferase class III-fold pyridoxal phosphate-dependent enzyme [Kofleriaceae bacterium]